MKYEKQIFTICILLLLVVFSQAQNSTKASGGEALCSTGTVSYSIGQLAKQTYTGTNASVAEGVQQPYEISVIIKIEEAKGINLTVSAYPNPTNDYFTLKVKEFDFSNLSFQLYDMNGKILQSEKINGTKTQINMRNYVPSSYFVKVTNRKQSIKEFKIIIK